MELYFNFYSKKLSHEQFKKLKMSSTEKKVYQRVDKFKEDEGMFEDVNQDDNCNPFPWIYLTLKQPSPSRKLERNEKTPRNPKLLTKSGTREDPEWRKFAGTS